jgi:hypothetical protein
MNENLKDILSNLNPEVDQEKLLQYLQGKLSAQEQHDLEKEMMGDDFDSDALEGLQEFGNKKKLAALVNQLNTDLKKRTEKKKRFKEKMKLTVDGNLIVAIVIILLLIILSYFILHKKMTQG